jgi:hypothetical protein
MFGIRHLARVVVVPVIATAALLVGGSDRAQAQQPSRLPPDVVLDYSYDAVHLLNGAGAPLYGADKRYQRFLEWLRQFPPTILIVGKEAPFTHSLGPILSFGGENAIFPRVPGQSKEDSRRLLKPNEVPLRIKAIRRFAEDAHAAGVTSLLPYVSPMTMYAEPNKRLGFLDFYDHWEKYAESFGLGKRPEADPMDWCQRDRQGELVFHFSPDKEYYKPLRRYSLCVDAPGWRQWQRLLARTIMDNGYDGLWLDNALLHRCECTHCQKLERDVSAESKAKALDVGLESYLRYFDDLRREGAKTVAINYGKLPFQVAVTDEVDLCMVEICWLGVPRLLWPGGTWSGLYRQGKTEAVVRDNLWQAQLTYAMRGRRGTHCLYGGPADNRRPNEFAHNKSSALLALAEGAAFGGGTAVHVVGWHGAPFLDDTDLPAHDARRRFFAFARQHLYLYENLLPAGDVALIVFPDRSLEALMEAQQIHQALLWRGILVDVLNGDTVREGQLKRYPLVIVPGQLALPDWMRKLKPLRGTDPLTADDLYAVKKAYQRVGKATPLRRTKLNEAALEPARPLRSLTLPRL